jgi:hypothetical protein
MSETGSAAESLLQRREIARRAAIVLEEIDRALEEDERYCG